LALDLLCFFNILDCSASCACEVWSVGVLELGSFRVLEFWYFGVWKFWVWVFWSVAPEAPSAVDAKVAADVVPHHAAVATAAAEVLHLVPA